LPPCRIIAATCVRLRFTGPYESIRVYDDDPADDEDWYDDDDVAGEDFIPCPECGKPIPEISDRCPACGYWLSSADRRSLNHGEAMPAWVKFTAFALLAAMLYGLATFLM
jgi:predicted amidophosphoribosyltransferase